MPVSAKSSDVLYNPSTGRRTISSATRLERNGVVRTNNKGTFLTSSSDRDVQGAVDLLNHLRTGTKVFGQVSSLVIPRLLSGDRSEGGAPHQPVVSALSINAGAIDNDADPKNSSHGRPLVKRPLLAGPPPSHQGTALTWQVSPNNAAEDASLAVAAKLASRRVTPLEMHRSEKLTAEPAVDPDKESEDLLGPVPKLRQLREELRQEVDWMKYWGNLENMHLFHKSLISRLTDAEATAAREHNDVAWMHERLQSLLKESLGMDEVMRQHQALAEEAVKRERGRQDSLTDHNALLNAKIVEMRRQVALTERSAHLLRGELDASLDATNKLKNELGNIEDKHRIDLLQLRRELAPDEAGDRLRRHRLETLEAESTRKDDMLTTLQSTLDVLEDEKRRLAEKVASLSAAAELNAKATTHSSGSAIDAVTIQNMTARQYQRREAELVASNTELRQANAALEVGVDTLKDRISRYASAVERELMQRHEAPQPPSEVAAPLQSAGRTPSAGTGKRGSISQKSNAPLPLQYVCSPLVFPDMASALNKAAVSVTPPDETPSALVEFRQRLVIDAPVAFDVFRDAATKLWTTTDSFVPEHPKRDPSGARETTHAWLTKSIDAMSRTMHKLVHDCNEAIATAAQEASAKTAALKHEAAVAMEQHAQALTAHNSRINELYDEIAAMKEKTTSAAREEERGNPAIDSTSTPVPPSSTGEGSLGQQHLERLTALIHKYAESSHVTLPAHARGSSSSGAVQSVAEGFDAAIRTLQDLMTGVVRRLSEKPTEVPTAITSPKRSPQVNAEAIETQKRAHEEAIASIKKGFTEQLDAAEAQRLALAHRLQETELQVKTTEPRFLELQRRNEALTMELAAARSEAAAAAAVRSVVTSPTTKGLSRPLSPCRECAKLREELRVALLQASQTNERDKRDLLQRLSSLEQERARLLDVADRLSTQLGRALEENAKRSVDSHQREKWNGGGNHRPTSAPGHSPSPSHHVHSFSAPHDLSSVAAMRQRIRHDRAPLADNSARGGAHDASQSVLHMELDPHHSIPGNPVYYAHTPVEPSSHRQLDVLHYMRLLKDAEFIARTPSPVPPSASHDMSVQFSPVPFFEVIGLPRAPSPTAMK
ncbi:Hypothetical protein, putative [Bodo saltans]|uniref:Uncharacterized protein n=1 Tax=Bodo saltans TaxID=75058 RepID=A0A0S4JS31_BODSA|nr:Hypothetical protein, putative [Bodo saltans]|eukprot:CUG92132.1 Hypothetical protein, putative [Bodo saltans]